MKIDWKKVWKKIVEWWNSTAPQEPAAGGGDSEPDEPDEIPDQDDPHPAHTLQEFGTGTIPIYIKTLYWWEDRAILAKELAACVNARVGYGYEMMGDSAKKVMLKGDLIAKVEDAYKFAINAARAGRIWLYVTIVNDNMGEGKYGDPGIPLADCMTGAKRLLEIVKKYGAENVICTPVAETKTSAGKSFNALAAKELAGFILADNSNGGHPSKVPTGFRLKVQHPCKLSDSAPESDGIVNDCGPAIIQMQGAYDKPLRASTAAAWVKNAQKVGNPFVGVYAFKFDGFDEAGIKACSPANNVPVVPPGEGDNIPVVSGNILPSQVKWNGPDFSKAKVTRTLTSVSISGNHLNFKLAAPLNWPKQGAKNVDGMGFLIRKINGQYVGGKVEWCVSSRGWYDIKTNVKDGYNGSTMPNNGETVWCGIGHPSSQTECTNLVPVVWK